MDRRRSIFLAALASALLVGHPLRAGGYATPAAARRPDWASARRFRVLVEVKPGKLAGRRSDERPAQVSLDLARLLAEARVGGRADLSTLQAMRYEATTGRPLPYNNYMYAETPADLPLRWYDAAIPDPFPDRDHRATDPWVYRPHWGSYYEVVGDWQRGRLVWPHTQEGDRPSYYAVYFDVMEAGGRPPAPAPRGWVGDGAHRTAKVGKNSTGLYHADAQMVDLNQDGRLDIVCGSSRGGILWYENSGTARQPRFTVARLLFQSDGRPIDPGFLSTPTAADWDGDGALDLLIGANEGYVYFYRNVGTKAAPVYEDKGPLLVDGQALRTPFTPVPEVEGPAGEPIYKVDYEPFAEVADWDGDGDQDLLVGGYVTGRIYFYENTGRGPDGVPSLTSRGHLTADGKPLDVGWAASPAAADVDGDGDLDLVTGVWRKWGNESPPEVVEDFLAFFENVGTRSRPALTMRPLPRIGEFPKDIVTSPTLADWDADGDLDLLVSAPSGNLYLIENAGDRKRPKFEARKAAPLPLPWGNDPFYAQHYVDWNRDGWTDYVTGGQVYLNTGRGLPWEFKRPFSLLPPDQTIDHRSWRGDDWDFRWLVDFDQDGQADILFGDFSGQVWFHKNLSQGGDASFDTKGVLVTRPDGTPLRVGPAADSPWDFTVLQGSRINVLADDFDGDGAVDLVLSDTYGRYYFCRRGRHGRAPVVEAQTLINDFPSRGNNNVADWDGDGRKDLLVSLGAKFYLFRNTGRPGLSPFAAPEQLALPVLPVLGSEILLGVTDVNRDGDQDVILHSDHSYTCFFERSFLDGGYAQGTVLTFQTREGNQK